FDRLCFVFFFQAEDGIRDLTVTGVQTCALPIFGFGVGGAGSMGAGCGNGKSGNVGPTGAHGAGATAVDIGSLDLSGYKGVPGLRSEERRVGKECRSAESP